MREKTKTLIAMSQKLIRKKLDLHSLPGITISVRAFAGPDKRGCYRLEKRRMEIDEPVELIWWDSSWFNRGVQQNQYS
jgi:hypothetical protein